MSKHCPECNQIYDDSENFCESDGSVLASISQSAETIVVKSPPSGFQNSQPVVKQPNLHLIYGVILLLSIIAVGFAVAYFSNQNRSPEAKKVVEDKSDNKANANTATGANTNVGTRANAAPNVSVSIDNKALNPAPPMTVEEVQGLLQKWENAQNQQRFSAYQDCYTAPFKGIKTTGKGNNTYDYNSWMADRRKMLKEATGLVVEIKNLNISIEGDLATATFDQYYRSLRYSDWGPKEMKIKQTPAGAKIVYENLKASYPL